MFAQKLVDLVLRKRLSHQLDALVRAYAHQGRFSGAVLVKHGEHVLLRKGYGYAEQAGDWAVNTPATTFRIGSMSKLFTAVTALQLVYAERLALTDTVAAYLPDFPNGDRITIKQLLSNRSGIEDFITLPAYEALQMRRVSADELVTLFRGLPLRFEPGTAYGYSNSNWVLLALIVERVTGVSFEQVVHERILRSARMRASGLDWSKAVSRAVGMIDTGAGIEAAPVLDSSTMRGGGDVHATLDDLHRFSQALLAGQLLPLSVLRSMWSPLTTVDNAGYGLGFEIHTLHKRAAVGHSGGIPGFVSNLILLPEDQVTILILSNLGSAAYEPMTESLAAIVLGEPYRLPEKSSVVEVAPEVLARYVGDYHMEYFGRTAILRFHVDGLGRLVMETQGLPATVLSAFSETRFYGRSKGEVNLTFADGQDDKTRQIDIVWGGYRLTAQRLQTA